MKIKNIIIITLVNLIVFIILIALLETSSHFIEKLPKKAISFDVNFHPYIMWTSDLPYQDNEFCFDQYTGKKYPVKMSPNNLQFASGFDYEFVPDDSFYKKLDKTDNTKIVLITGGSAVHGYGATDNAHAVSGQLERYLNMFQSKYKYKVVNMGMGSWVAFQEFICLSLYGKRFKPDWIVAMDGINDSDSFSSHSAGAGNPMFWPSMMYYLNGKKLRNNFEKFLIKHSGSYRVFTHTSINDLDEQDGLKFNMNNPDPRFRVMLDTKWIDIEKQIDFYIYSHELMLSMFDDARFIFSTQPKAEGYGYYYNNYFIDDDPVEKEANRRVLKDGLIKIYNKNKDKSALDANGGESEYYFIYSSLFKYEELVKKFKKAGLYDVEYSNPEACFTYEPNTGHINRRKYFVDSVHYNDKGHELLGMYFALQIINRDFKPDVSDSMTKSLNHSISSFISDTEGQERKIFNLQKIKY